MLERAQAIVARMEACKTCPTPCVPLPDAKDLSAKCPLSRWAEPPKAGLGTVIENLVKPFARAIKAPCLDPNGKLNPESGCAKRRDTLNRMFPG